MYYIMHYGHGKNLRKVNFKAAHVPTYKVASKKYIGPTIKRDRGGSSSRHLNSLKGQKMFGAFYHCCTIWSDGIKHC